MKYKKINITNILKKSFNFIFNNYIEITKAVAFSGFTLFSFSILWELYGNNLNEIMQWFFILFNIIFTALLAVQCHRLVLLSEKSTNILNTITWRRFETQYLILSIGLTLIAGVLSLPMFLLMLFSSHLIPIISSELGISGAYLQLIPSILIGCVFGYLFARLSLVLPAVAIGGDDSLWTAWNKTSNNGWRLFILFFGLTILLPMLLSKIIYFIIPSLDNTSLIIILISNIIDILMIILEIIILSFTYQFLTTSES